MMPMHTLNHTGKRTSTPNHDANACTELLHREKNLDTKELPLRHELAIDLERFSHAVE